MLASKDVHDAVEQILRHTKPDETLMVMAQSPGNNYHWTKRVIEISATDLARVLRDALIIADIRDELGADLAKAQSE